MGDILQIGGSQWLRLHPDTPALNMARAIMVTPTGDGGVAVHWNPGGPSSIYHGDEAERIRQWLAQHGDLPTLGT